jgi:F-type H+-transporting ATPase subunit b
MLFSLDATLVVFVISFLIFMVLLNEVMLKPVGRTLDQRAKYIEDQIAEGKQAHREAEALQTDYDNNLKRIREEAQHVIAKAVDEANKARGEQLGKIAAEERELVETIARKVLGDESVNVSIDAGQVRRTLEEAR